MTRNFCFHSPSQLLYSAVIYQNSHLHSSSMTSCLKTMGLTSFFPAFYWYFLLELGSKDHLFVKDPLLVVDPHVPKLASVAIWGPASESGRHAFREENNFFWLMGQWGHLGMSCHFYHAWSAQAQCMGFPTSQFLAKKQHGCLWLVLRFSRLPCLWRARAACWMSILVSFFYIFKTYGPRGKKNMVWRGKLRQSVSSRRRGYSLVNDREVQFCWGRLVEYQNLVVATKSPQFELICIPAFHRWSGDEHHSSQFVNSSIIVSPYWSKAPYLFISNYLYSLSCYVMLLLYACEFSVYCISSCYYVSINSIWANL